MLFNSAKQRVGKRLDVDTITFETGRLLNCVQPNPVFSRTWIQK